MVGAHSLFLAVYRYADRNTDPLDWLIGNLAPEAVEIAFNAAMAACARACDAGEIEPTRVITTAEWRPRRSPYDAVRLQKIVLGDSGWRVDTTARTERWLGVSTISDDQGAEYLVTHTHAEAVRRCRSNVTRVQQRCYPKVPPTAKSLSLIINPLEPEDSLIRVALPSS